MTQLVELQHILPELRAAGYRPYAISNDTVARLAEFAERNTITFPLLSDEDSAVIKRYGILNTLIAPDEGKHMRWHGIPYPGTYITDANGVIVRKDFHQHHARRASGQTLLHQLTGAVPDDATARRATTDGPVVTVEAVLLDPTLRLEVLSTLVCRVQVADGYHLYAHGAPEMFMPAQITVSGDGIRAGEPSWPTPHLFDMPMMGSHDVPVWDGRFTITVPVTATSELIKLGHGLNKPNAEIEVALAFQACNDEACEMPATTIVHLAVPLAILVEPDGIKSYVARTPIT